MQPLDLLGSALAYARRGWLVFPIRPGLKIPATANGFLDAVGDPDKIAEWWSKNRGWDRRNVGVVTSPQSGIWVLDADVDKETGEFGEDTLAELEGEHGTLPAHPVSETPSGGKHHVFAWPDDGMDLPRRIRFMPGLDALGSRDGKAGYFIAAPSVRPDGVYKWSVRPDDVTPPQAPKWLLDIIRADVKTRPADMPVYTPIKSDRTNAYGRKVLEERLAQIRSAPFGQQEVTLSASALRVFSEAHGGNIDLNEAMSGLMDAAMSMPNQPGKAPWVHQDIEKKLRTASAKAQRDPSPPRQAYQRRDPPPPERTRPQLVVSNPVKPEPAHDPEPDAAHLPEWMREHAKYWLWKDDISLQATAIKNVQLMVEFHPDLVGIYRYDEFRDQVFVTRPLPGDTRNMFPRELVDADETALAAWLNWHGLSPAISTVGAVIREVAFRNSFDPLREWVDGLVWDGDARVGKWLSRYAGAEDNAYNSLVGTKFMIGAIARAVDPGAKVDAMMVIEGPQNLGKSTLIRELCGADMFSDQVGDVTSKDSSERIQGCWLVEIPEMDKFSRHEANAVKDFLSRREDRYRPAYGRSVVKRPRRTVFFGTINPDGIGYLKDSTGNRRFWPVKVTKIDLKAVARDREQLWAEALYRYREGEEWWIAPEDAHIVEPEQEARRDDDVWEPKVAAWLASELEGKLSFSFSSAECLHKAIGMMLDKQSQREKIRIAKILNMYGCDQVNNTNGIKGRSWVYERKD